MATGRFPTTANSPLTAKGDLFTYSTGSANLAVGADGTTLVADSSTSTGLRYQATNAAGKNAVINGAMEVWQRGTSFAGVGFTADRWYAQTSNAITRSTTAPTGFNYSLNWVTSGSYPVVTTYIELPVTGAKGNFTGNWVMSFYAKASTATTFTTEAYWTDGSARTNAVSIASQNNSLTTSWTRFTMPVNFDSSSPGATNKAIELTTFVVTGGATINITGVQLEIGAVPTAFTRAGGTLQGELAACQRYFLKYGGNQVYETFPGVLLSYSTTQGEGPIAFKSTMRTTPTVAFSTLKVSDVATFNVAVTNITITTNTSGPDAAYLVFTVASGVTSGKTILLRTDGSTAGYLTFSAEL